MASKVAIEVEIKNIKQIADLKKELKELRKAQKDQEAESKSGRFQSKESAKAYKERAKAIKENSKQLRTLNKDMAGATKSTKNITKSNNGMAKQFVKGAAAIGVVVGAFRTLNRVISSVITTFSDFEFVMAKVNAVSGATEQELQGLTKTAQELGRTTFFTATQVGELMLNFSKLGFTAQEIQDAVQPTLDLATATGSDLARAATVAASAVRGFGLDADETARVTDVMAVSFASSAMDIEKWQTSMTKVAPIAKAAGFSIEDTAAIMSQLADSGIEASIAGTSLRNILLKMQDPASDLSQAFGGTIHSLDEMIPAFEKFREEGGNMAEILQVVDLRQAAAFEQMLSNVDKIEQLRDKMKDSNGEAARMAAIIGDTLQGAFLKFTSAVQGLSIAVMEDFANGLKNSIESVAKFIVVLSENSETISKVIRGMATLVKGFAAGWLALKSLTAGMWLYKAGLAAVSTMTGTATFATKRFIVSLKGLKLAISKTGVGLLVIALAEVGTNLLFAGDAAEDFNDTLDETLDKKSRLKKIEDDLNKVMVKQLADTKRGAEINIELIKKEIEARKGQISNSLLYLGEYADTLSIVSKAEEDALVKAIDRLNFKLGLEEDNLKAIKKRLAQEKAMSNDLLTIENKKLEAAQNTAATTEEQLTAKNKLIQSIQEEINRLTELGVEQKKVNDEKKIDNTLAWARVDVMKQVIDGTKSLKDAERELTDMAISRTQAELDAIPATIMNGELRLELEQKLLDLKMKNRKEDEKDSKSRKEQIDDVGALGDQIIKLAGEDEKMQGIKKAGIALSSAAAIANNIEALSLAAKGVATQSTEPFPKNIIGMISTLATIVSLFANIKAMKSAFGDGGVIETFANGGMVHGKSHAQGGEKFAVGGRVVELEGGEAVINKRSTAMFGSQLSAMNAAGGGVKFADGGLLNSPSFAQQQFSGNIGGGGGAQKVYVVEADISQSQNQVSVLEASATI